MTPQAFSVLGLKPALQAVEGLGHFEDLLAMVQQSATAGAQTGLLHLQIHCAQQHSQGGMELATRLMGQERQAQQIGWRPMGLDLTVEHRIQDAHRHHRWHQPRTHEFHVDAMGEVAQTPMEGNLHSLQPMDQQHRIPGQLPVCPEGIGGRGRLNPGGEALGD